MRNRFRRSLSVGTVAVLLLMIFGFVPAATDASVPNVFPTLRATIVGTPSIASYDLQGVSEYDPSNLSGGICCYAHTDVIDIATGGGTRNRPFALHLEAPDGQTFHVGTYFGDDVYGVRGYAYVSEGSTSCDYVEYTITDLAFSGTTVTRLDVQFQTYCGGYISSTDGTVFGEVSFNEPYTAGTSTGARFLRWPDIPVGADTPVRVPVWIRNTRATAVQLGQASRTGGQAADFRVVADGCSGHLLAAHSACAVQVVFHPTAAGTRNAWLNVPVGARYVTTRLLGVGSPGTTLLRMNSQPGEWIGAGRSYYIPNKQEQMRVATAGPERFVGEVGDVGALPEVWTVEITAPGGQSIGVGSHSTTGSGGPNYTGWALDVFGDGRGCNDSTGYVTITQAQFDADHAPIAFHSTFTITCHDVGSTGSLTGEIEYHATA